MLYGVVIARRPVEIREVETRIIITIARIRISRCREIVLLISTRLLWRVLRKVVYSREAGYPKGKIK